MHGKSGSSGREYLPPTDCRWSYRIYIKSSFYWNLLRRTHIRIPRCSLQSQRLVWRNPFISFSLSRFFCVQLPGARCMAGGRPGSLLRKFNQSCTKIHQNWDEWSGGAAASSYMCVHTTFLWDHKLFAFLHSNYACCNSVLHFSTSISTRWDFCFKSSPTNFYP